MPKGNEAKVELGLLKVFAALAAEGSVTRASRTLRLSQPAVSKALNRLRRSFADPLFVRTGQGLVPTARARSLHLPVQRLLADAESLWTAKEAYDPERDAGTFTVACSDAEAVMLPHAVKLLAEEAPRATLCVRPLPQDTLKALETFALDVAIRPEIAPTQAVRRRVLYRKSFRCIARVGHPALEGGLTLDGYARASHVFVSIGEPGGRSVVTEALAARRVERHIAVTVPSFFEAALLVSQTDLICTAPASFADAMAALLPLQKAPPPIEIPEIEICLLWHEARDAEPRQRFLREALLRSSRALRG
ncbi:MAG TPA: LysR family transcriptional regulator [Myxococcales bacterium]|nr:LysR family transcriptional regulator [Myxococcales bacterium]